MTVRLFHVEHPEAMFHVKHLASQVSFYYSRASVGGQSVARVIAIANQKGGVGKTTTAVNLGASLAATEQRTLIIDCDPQGNATSALGFPKDPARRTLYQALILDEPIAGIITDAHMDLLDLIPSDKNLVGAAIELISVEHREYRLKALVA